MSPASVISYDGKLAARCGIVTDDSESAAPSSPADQPERPLPELPAFAAVRARTATALQARSGHIAGQWEDQSRTVALREPATDDGVGARSMAVSLVESLAAAIASDGATSDDLVVLGLAFGTDAFERGGSLHHALKGLDLLSAMVLFAVETSIADEADATAADGVRVCRRLQQASSLLTLAAAKGYTQEMGDAMRDRFRHLRHDLRNPLGTIKSVLAMMDDETMPAEARAHPRFRAMAKRNARSLGELISDRLSDMEAVAPVLAQQSASLRTIACGVRRTLRADAELRAIRVRVGNAPVRVMVDAVGLELLLHEVLHTMLQESSAGDEIHIEFGAVRDERAELTLERRPPREPIADVDALARLTTLAAQMKGELEMHGSSITLSVPVRRVELTVLPPDAITPALPVAPNEGDSTTVANQRTPSGGREPGYDVRGAREREHGESRPL